MARGFYEGKPNDYGVAEMGENIQKVTAAIGGIFQQRYQQKQYQDFIEGPQKEYEAKLKTVQDLLLDEENPEGPSQGIKMMSVALSTYMDEAGRYKNNPLISGRAEAAFKGNSFMLEQIFTSRINEAKMANQQTKIGLEAAKTAGTLQEQSARTGLINAQTEALKLGRIGITASGRLGKASGGKGTGGPAFLTGGTGQIDPNLTPEGQLDQAYAIASGNLTNPSNAAEQKQRQAEIGAVRHSLAAQDVIERAGRGEQRDIFDVASNTTKQEPWDPTNEGHIKEAEALVDPEDARNKYLYTKLLEEAPITMPGVTPDVIERKFGWMKDANLANPNAPVTREMSESNVGKILLGYEGWTSLKDQKSGKMPLDLTEAAQHLPDDYTKLQGPLRKGVDAAVGSMINGTIKPKSVEDVKALMKSAMYSVSGEYIGGGHANDKVTQGVRKSRYAAKKFADAIAEKYADTIATNLGLKAKPKEEESGFNIPTEFLRKYTPLGDVESLLGGIGDEAKGLLEKVRE